MNKRIATIILSVIFLLCFSAGVLGAESFEEKYENIVVDKENNTVTYLPENSSNPSLKSIEEEEFIDVPDNSWYQMFVSHQHQLGIINGVTEKEFAPNIEVTRA